MPKKLTPMQELFVKEYLKDLNAAQAAIRAGYSPKNANKKGFSLLNNPLIAAEIQLKKQARADELGVEAKNILLEYARIGFSDVRDVAEWDNEGVLLKPSREITDDAARAVSEVSQSRYGPKLKLHSKLKALVELSKHIGLGDKKPNQEQGPVIIQLPIDPDEV